jgi:hypothetical protein
MERFFESSYFREQLSPIPRAYENLVKLKDSYELHIVTARQHAVEDLTRAWINRYYPNIFADIHFGNHYSRSGKSRSKAQMCKEIGAVMLIDDSLSYATQVSREGIQVLLFGDYAWNQVKASNNSENVEIIFSPHTKDEVVIHDYSDEQFEMDHENGSHSIGRRLVYRVHDWDVVPLAMNRILSVSGPIPSVSDTNNNSSLFDLRVAVIQMCSVNDKETNFQKIEELVAKARADVIEGLDLVCLPECCMFIGNSMEETLHHAETVTEWSPSIQRLSNLAKLHHIYISVGGFPEYRNDDDGNKMMSNCHFIINQEGVILKPTYRKIHLFDCPYLNICESKMTGK